MMMVDEGELIGDTPPNDDVEAELEEEGDEEEEIESVEPDTKIFLVKQSTSPEVPDDTEFGVSPIPVYKHDGLQSYMDVLVLLRNLDPNDERLTRVPPQRPIAAGQVYVYTLTPGQSPYDWRFDGFQWANLRANCFPKKHSNPILTRHEFRLLDNGNKVDFFRHEYHEPGHNFKIPIHINSWKHPYIVIHYFGNYPVNEALLAPHAGRRSGGGPIMRTPKKSKVPGNNYLARAINSAVASITDGSESIEASIFVDEEEASPTKKRKLNDPLGGGVYENVGEEGDGNSNNGHKIINLSQLALLTVNGIEVTGPNLKHRNPSSNSKKGKASLYLANLPLTKDDIYGCYAFQEMFSGASRVIRRLDFTHGSNIVIAENHLLTHINTLASVDFLDTKITFTYQATAKLYRFLVSTLFVKHPLFENEPCIPLAVLLHRRHNSETHGSFFRTMKELLPFLNSAEINLIVCDESGVTKAVENELPEIPTVHVSDSTGPRISSAKLDFLLVSVAKSLTFDHTKMLHLVYFLQCHIYNEIIRSLIGSCEGDLLIQSKYDTFTCATPPLAERVLPEGPIVILDDALGPSELIAMLSKNPPQVLGSGSDYESCSKNELQLFEGLAHFFIAKDRIDWIKAKGMFSVKGLGGTDYEVQLSGRTCTCPRGKACEHVLGVLIATGSPYVDPPTEAEALPALLKGFSLN